MDSEHSPRLAQQLGFWSALAIVVGSVIGSGIFKKSSVMAAQLGSAELLLLVWALAGAITLCGALTNAEIASMLPLTGGQYQFFRVMYGDFFAYLYGWAMVAVVQTGSIASIAYVFAEHFSYLVPLPRLPASVEHAWALAVPGIGTLFPLENLGVKLLTLAAIWVLTVVNVNGARLGGGIQVLLTGLKLGMLLALIAIALVVTGLSTPAASTSPSLPTPTGWQLAGAFAAALSGAFWAYDGWNNVTYVAGEVRSAERSIPSALVLGMLTVTAIYLLVNLSYILALPLPELARSQLVGVDAARALIGEPGALLLAAGVIVSTLGTTNGTILASARLSYAMAEAGSFFPQLRYVHPRFRTPTRALWLQALWASVLVISGSFDILTDMLIFVSWGFYALGAAGIFVLRRRYPEAPRPWRVWGYPVVPLLFVLFATLYVVLSLVEDISAFRAGESPIVRTVAGIALTCAGIPLYALLRRRSTSAEVFPKLLKTDESRAIPPAPDNP
jgi:APA family basic amino acid/polyamine antiporter